MSRKQSNKELTVEEQRDQNRETRNEIETVKQNLENFFNLETLYRELLARNCSRDQLKTYVRLFDISVCCIFIYFAESLMNLFMLMKDCVFILFMGFLWAFV